MRFCPPTIVLSQVEPSSVLAGHGLSSGDVVVSVNGKLPESIEQFSETVRHLRCVNDIQLQRVLL